MIYPVSETSTFDHAYYAETHLPLVTEHMGPHIQTTLVTKGLSGGPDVPAPFHAIASFTFAGQGAMKAAMKASGPVMADVANFTNIQPQVLIGETLG